MQISQQVGNEYKVVKAHTFEFYFFPFSIRIEFT